VAGRARYSRVWRDPTLTWERVIALALAADAVIMALEVGEDYRRQSRRRLALTAVHDEIADLAARLAGPMPGVVREFLDRHSPRAV